ncbi:MAG: ABC transporter permease [bacterium]
MKGEEKKSGGTAAASATRGRSLWTDAWRRLRRNRMAMAGLAILGVMVAVALLTPLIAPYGFADISLEEQNQPPCRAHWMGTDHLGRDLMTRVMYGARISLAVGICATLVSLFIGVTYGALAGFVGGRADNVMMRFVDVLYGLPFMFFVIILVVVAGRSIINLFIALGAVQWLTMSRIARGQAMSIRSRDFITAARTCGAGTPRILLTHVIPNLLGPVIVYFTLTIPAVMLEEAFLSFLGLGVQPPNASWGSLASEGIGSITLYPWQIFFPGFALAVTLLALNFLGDGLRDALDPLMKEARK